MKTKSVNGIADTLTGRNETVINRMVTAFFAITVSCIMLSVCFLSFVEYPFKKTWISNIIPIAAVTPVLLSAAVISIRPGKRYRTKTWKAAIVLLLFLFQLLSVYCYYFYTGWDVKRVISTSLRLAHGEESRITAYTYTYYSNYPNNLFLTSVFSGIIRVLNRVFPQTKGTEAEYMVLLAVQCLISQTAGILTYCAAKRLFGRERYACISYCLFVFLAGISPWVSIPYSDSMGLAVPIGILLLYFTPAEGKKVILKWFGIAAISWLGFKLKPQLAVISIAILIIELFSGHTRKEILKALSGIAAGIACAVLIVTGCLHFFCNIETKPEKRFGMAHFLMMGMNPGRGVWDADDVAYSRSFDTARERDSANIQRAAERIGEMGPAGLAKQFIRKTLVNYNDGTFAWDGEGNFYTEIREKPDDSFSSFLRNLYYITGKHHPIWKQFVQAVWVTVLFLNFFSVFGKKDKTRSVMMLTVIGLTIFLTVFEARARYVYTNLPIFILLAVSGLNSITDRVQSMKRRVVNQF